MGLISGLAGLAGGDAKRDAANQNASIAATLYGKGTKWIDSADTSARGDINAVGDIYGDMADRGLAGLTPYEDALGLHGAEGSDAAREMFREAPGYAYAEEKGLDAIDRRAAARGNFQSGGTGLDELTFAHGLADQGWNSWLDRLMGNNQQNASFYETGTAGKAGAKYGLAGLTTNTRDTRLDLGSTVASSLMNANNQKAEGKNEMFSGIGDIGSGFASLIPQGSAFRGFL